MAKMKTLMPKMKVIQERYAADKMKMNQEMMQLYKTEKVNPMGGCLPIVIQIPVFMALYWTLLGAVEMRQAPWIGWIHDLSAMDPYYILPVIMATSMFIQSKLNPDATVRSSTGQSDDGHAADLRRHVPVDAISRLVLVLGQESTPCRSPSSGTVHPDDRGRVPNPSNPVIAAIATAARSRWRGCGACLRP